MPDMNPTYDDKVVVDFPCSTFSVEAVKRAAYSLMARYDVAVDMTADAVRCVVGPANPKTDMSNAARDLRREVVDHDLRISIEQRTQPYRDAILGLAFSKTGLQDG
jgi:His-Xaa-Ser system protein HxsD